MTKVRLAVLCAVFLCLQCVASADSTGSFDNQGGVLTAVQVDHSGTYQLTVTNSPLTSVSGVYGLNCGGSLGTTCSGGIGFKLPAVSLSAIDNVNGPPLVFLGSDFGSFTLKENGATVFTGYFTSATWTFTGNTSTNDYQWTLMGNITGTYKVGNMTETVNAALVQLTVSASSDPFTATGTKRIGISGGNTNLPGVVPESGTLVLFGTGLIGIVLAARRKYFSDIRA